MSTTTAATGQTTGLQTISNEKQDVEDHMPAKGLINLSLSSQAVHGDDFLNKGQDIAPALHVSTTFRYTDNPDELIPEADLDPNVEHEGHIYSRSTAPNSTRLEAILSTVLKGPSITYASGLSAFHALLVFLNPKSISIGDGYHGCHGVISIHQKLTGLKKLSLDCDPSELQEGDVVHIETPLNPTGHVCNIAEYARKAHERGAFLTVDATFAPPPLQDPFEWGADVVMHSGTKYIGGHSDLLCGILAINPKHNDDKWFQKLRDERTYIGNVIGNMESWLSIRSIRTLEIRVERQSTNTTELVQWLNDALNGTDLANTRSEDAQDNKIIRAAVKSVEHGSLQQADIAAGWLTKQMPNGTGPIFAIVMKTEQFARRLPSKLSLFHHATSLGGVESLIEWRYMSDDGIDPKLMRVSVGVEGWRDLRDDLLRGFRALLDEVK